ncbi:MAG: DUF262 domain-containing protein [Saprospiraceae bacterium]|nr:DUF262 domain-containing protein [Saprospiraceae bacterium]
MSQSLIIKTQIERLSGYIASFEKGNLQVPAFQRDFVWKNEAKLALFDSILKGYPIGTVLLWKPENSSEFDYEGFSTDRMGTYRIPPKNANSFYIIDGVQRLSTLIGCLLHPIKSEHKGIDRLEVEWQKDFNIVYNLRDEAFEPNRFKSNDKLDFFQIPVYKLVDAKEFFEFQRQLPKFESDEQKIKEYLQRYEDVSLIFQYYEIPRIEIHGGSISEAIDIFQRMNSTGAKITVDWVVSARAIGKDPSFRLGTEIDNLLDIDLRGYNFQNLKRDVILQSITNSFGGVYFDQISKNDFRKIEALVDRDDFIEVTKKTFGSIQKAAKFLFENLFVIDSKLLPYNNQLIFISDFFNKIDNPTTIQFESLKKWFWVTTYSSYFTIYNLSKQRLAYNKFQEFIENEEANPIYNDRGDEEFETVEFPSKIEMGSVRSKALALFMLQHQSYNHNLNPESVNGFRTIKLFKDFGENGKEANISENTVLIIDDEHCSISKSQKDLTEWLNSDESHDLFFITTDMKTAFREGKSKGEILSMRRELIMRKEREFVEGFDLRYLAD